MQLIGTGEGLAVMRAIFTVFSKEFRENLRDRRTLFTALIFGPLFAPLLFAAVLSLMIQRGDCAEGRAAVAGRGACRSARRISSSQLRDVRREGRAGRITTMRRRARPCSGTSTRSC